MFEEPTIADGVAPALGVLSAIQFDNEPFLSANKIDNGPSDWLLTHEFESAERARAQLAPKPPPYLPRARGRVGVGAGLSFAAIV